MMWDYFKMLQIRKGLRMFTDASEIFFKYWLKIHVCVKPLFFSTDIKVKVKRSNKNIFVEVSYKHNLIDFSVYCYYSLNIKIDKGNKYTLAGF